MKLQLLLCIVGVFIVSTNGLQCWTCKNAKGIQDCIDNGRPKTCKSNEEACEIILRRRQNGEFGIFKGCKAGRACTNNWIQNPKPAASPTQCNDVQQASSVCRCCCFTNNCTRNNIDCGSGTPLGTTRKTPPLPKSCAPPRPKKNGAFVCEEGEQNAVQPNGRYLPGARCEYYCLEGYFSTRSGSTVCLQTRGKGNYIFIPPAPTCRKPKCQRIFNTRRRFADCTGNEVGDTCTFTCARGYGLSPSNLNTSTCLDDSTWSPLPCCGKEECDIALDLAIILDASTSIGPRNWRVMLNFVESLIRNLKVGPDEFQVAVFSYSSRVHRSSAIFLNETSDKASLLEAVSKLPYNRGTTFTGRALKYARQSIFARRNGDRPNVPNTMLVVTDGAAYDPRSVKKEADLLHADGVTGFGVGVGDYREQDLLSIAGTRDRIFSVTFEGLNDKFARELGKQVCVAASCNDV